MPVFVNFCIPFVSHDNKDDEGTGIEDPLPKKPRKNVVKNIPRYSGPSLEPGCRQKAGRRTEKLQKLHKAKEMCFSLFTFSLIFH